MISLFRRAASSWIVLGLLGLVIVAFIVTGIGDPFGGRGSATTVAEVAGQKISDVQLSNQFDRQLQALRQEQPGITAAQLVEGDGLEGVLERLIGSEALMAMADKLGLVASKRQVDAEIANVPAFRGPDGRFSEMTFRERIQAQGLEEAAVRAEIGGDVVRRQLLALVDNPSITPRLLAEPFAALQLERRTLQIGAIPVQGFSNVAAPSEADINAYYRKNIARFTLPERRKISYALIDRAVIAASVVPAEADFAAYYKDHAAEFVASEKRALSQVVVQSRSDADTIVRRVSAGEPLAAVAAEVAGFSAEDLSLGTLTKAELATTVSEAVADAAFKVAEGKMAAPIKSDFGWHVVRADKIVAQPARTLAAVRDEIAPAVKAELVEKSIADMTGRADDAFADGANLAEVAKDLGLTTVSLPPVTSDGLTLGKTDARLDDRIRPLIERAFKYDPDEDAAVDEIAPGLQAIIDVEEVLPPTAIPLDDLKLQVAGAIRFERQLQAAKATADEIVAGVRSGKPMAGLFGVRKLPAPQSITARRIELSQRQQAIPAPVSLGFALPKGEVRAIAQPQSGAYFVVHVADVIPGNPAEAPAFIDSLRSQMREAAAGEIAQNFVGAIMADVGVKRFPDAIERMKQQYVGTAPAQ